MRTTSRFSHASTFAALPGDDAPLFLDVGGASSGNFDARCVTSEKFMACRLTPGFPELREQLEIMVQQCVRQYLIEGLELFAVHHCPLAQTSCVRPDGS
jgi:hypothetical protein